MLSTDIVEENYVMEQYTKFRTDTRKPKVKLAPNSCDCQIHVFGDPGKYPLRQQSAYTPPQEATIGEALRMHRALGIDRGIIVQSTAYGTDHKTLIDALAAAGPNYRGVAIVDDSVSDTELLRLHEAGVRGGRFNFWKQLNIVPTAEGFLRSIDRIKEYGWHAKIHSAGDEWLELTNLLAKVTIPVVIDHMGHPELGKGPNQPSIKMILNLLRKENWWVMVSNGDRVSAEEQGWSDALPFAQMLIEAAPDRSIWCTDWPHVQYRKPMPNDADLVDYFYRAAPDPVQRQKILVDNPARLLAF